MLRYYSPEWQTVLHNAKNIYRFWLATDNPYPTPMDGYAEAQESIVEAVGNFLHEGGALEGSPLFILILRHL